MALFIYSYSPVSEGARNLKEALRIRKIRNERSTFQGGVRHTVINWGSTRVPAEVQKCRILNPPASVLDSANKLHFFRKISAANRDLLPPWTEDASEAMEWSAKGSSVCARKILNGHSAAGLVILDRTSPKWEQAPLYTKYIKKEEEYRVHIVDGEVIDLQRKVLSKEKGESGETINWKIRNHDNGFIYQRQGINPPDEVRRVAIAAMRASGLDFGAVDVIYNKSGRAYVLEINTAPGLTGTTVENYANAFRRYL